MKCLIVCCPGRRTRWGATATLPSLLLYPRVWTHLMNQSPHSSLPIVRVPLGECSSLLTEGVGCLAFHAQLGACIKQFAPLICAEIQRPVLPLELKLLPSPSPLPLPSVSVEPSSLSFTNKLWVLLSSFSEASSSHHARENPLLIARECGLRTE